MYRLSGTEIEKKFMQISELAQGIVVELTNLIVPISDVTEATYGFVCASPGTYQPHSKRGGNLT
jgi:hypothetical protein